MVASEVLDPAAKPSVVERPWRRRRYDVRINLPLRRSTREALERAAMKEDVSPCVVARRGIESELQRLQKLGVLESSNQSARSPQEPPTRLSSAAADERTLNRRGQKAQPW